MSRNGCPSHAAAIVRFRALFGVTPTVCSRAWLLLRDRLPKDARPFHLLWALFFLKTYASEHVNNMFCSVDAKTLWKWSRKFVTYLADLDIVSTESWKFTKSVYLT